MARPIEPTPTLDGEDADRLLESLDKHASPAEMKERQRRAKEYLEEIRKPKSLACRKTDGKFQFAPHHKVVMYASAMPDQNGEALGSLSDPFSHLKPIILNWPRNY